MHCNVFTQNITFGETNNPELRYYTKPKTTKYLLDIFSQSILDHIHNTNSGKLKFISTVKEIYGKENYLKIKKNKRTSSHNLEIETGRWVNAKRYERMCKQCNENKIEGENHLLFEYKASAQKNDLPPSNLSNRSSVLTYHVDCVKVTT